MKLTTHPVPSSRHTLWERRGALGWWLNVTAPPRPPDMSTLQVREYIRKAELISLVNVATGIFLLGLVSNSFSDPSTAIASIFMGIGVGVTMVLNRVGKVTEAAYLLVCMMMFVIILSLLDAKGGLRLIWFTTFDIFLIPIAVSSWIITRKSAIYCAVFAIIFVLLYYAYYPHALLNGYGAHNFDELLYEVKQPYFSWWALINRNVLLLAFIGFLSWVGSLSFEKALAWGEQARNEALLAQMIAHYKEHSEEELNNFVNEVTLAFVARARGEARFMQDRPIDDPLHGAVLFVNEQLQMMEQHRR